MEGSVSGQEVSWISHNICWQTGNFRYRSGRSIRQDKSGRNIR